VVQGLGRQPDRPGPGLTLCSSQGATYLGDAVSNQLAHVARDVRGAVIPASGHNIALENPAALAQAYLDFFAGG
jgi:pimeloyl-ACP methyl ester carboxylesterase